ncbi:hypothetical protein SteCoe_14498 [Stentor coeruleus]|uniref:Glutamine amidotransferase domain-containing protein n=1 Tax=Stentor coeruleus TaxID=5963 RepID=A0A1R2C610_9CILI|nr:hypothetical protein SteCoe_14498 [Stentor coeruleus]
MKVFPYRLNRGIMWIGKELSVRIEDEVVNWVFACAGCLWNEFYGGVGEDVLELCDREEFCKLLKHVAIHGFISKDTISIPLSDFFPEKFRYKIQNGILDYNLYQNRYTLAQEYNFIQRPLDSSGFSAYEEPDFLLFLLHDYKPWPGIEEALYSGFFKKGLEKWNFYYLPKNEYPTEKAFQSSKAIISNGAKYSANDAFPWISYFMQLIQRIHIEKSKRLIGICLTHQITGKALGGRIGRNPCGYYVHKIEDIRAINDIFHIIGIRNCVKFQESHGECVLDVPENCRVLYRSDTCDVEMMLIGDDILTVQFHPEYTVCFGRKLLAKWALERRIIDEERFEELLKNAQATDSYALIDFFNGFIRKIKNF